MTLRLTTRRRAGRRQAVGSVVCDWCEVRWPSFGLATVDDMSVEVGDWDRMGGRPNLDMCPDCRDLVWAEARAEMEGLQ